MLAAMAPTAFAALVDSREFLGIDVWMKPFKFELALAVYTLTLAFFARFLPTARPPSAGIASMQPRWSARSSSR